MPNWYGMVWYGMEWYGMEWIGMDWFTIFYLEIITKFEKKNINIKIILIKKHDHSLDSSKFRRKQPLALFQNFISPFHSINNIFIQ